MIAHNRTTPWWCSNRRFWRGMLTRRYLIACWKAWRDRQRGFWFPPDVL